MLRIVAQGYGTAGKLQPLLRASDIILKTRYLSSSSSATLKNLYDDLESRSLIYDVTSPELKSRLNNPITLYCGIDPTADSIHIGNLLPLSCLLRFLSHGHSVIALIGGATGSIGDPSGRSTERNALTSEQLRHNVEGITTQVTRFFENGLKYAEKRLKSDSRGWETRLSFRNNLEWFGQMNVLQFLGDTGRLSRVSTMMARESVKSRLDSTAGISFTEFTYQLLQAYDFWHLYQQNNCQLQIGGSDQWGNIVAGVDLIRRKSNEIRSSETPFGLTLPLVTTSDGQKFGKSAGNAVWMDGVRTSVFDFYQFFINTSDSDVEKYLNYFTFLQAESISNIMEMHKVNPEARKAQSVLASEITELVHGEQSLRRAQLQTSLLFPSRHEAIDQMLKRITPKDLIDCFHGTERIKKVPKVEVLKEQVSEISGSVDVAKFLAMSGVVKSRSQAVKLTTRGGIYINNTRITDPNEKLDTSKHFLPGKGGDGDHLKNDLVSLVRIGKKEYFVIHVM